MAAVLLHIWTAFGMPKTWLLLLLGVLLMEPAGGQQPASSSTRRPMAAVKTATPPAIDGDLSDPAWKTAPRAEIFYDRQTNAPAPDQTTAYLLYDDRYIYVAFYCKDSEPDKIVGRETVRDSRYNNGGTEDSVEFVLDAFQSHQFQDLSRFSVNPLGTPSARLGGGRANKTEWKGDWDAAAKRVSDGWTAEMRIPWAILNYRAGQAPQTFGLNFARFQEHTRIDSVWSNTGGQGFLELEGLWTGVQVPQTAFRPTLSVLPYVLPSLYRTQPGFRSGVDARYTITPQLTAVGSLNPDFGTIEGAVESIQFSRSEPFVPERRPFFLEGAQYIEFGQFYSVGRYFYPRRVETFTTGMKVYGKVTPVDSLGILNTTYFRNRNDLVANYRRDLSPTSSAGFFLMEKSAVDDYNRVGVLNGSSRWGKLGLATELAFSGGVDAGGGAREVSLSYGDKTWFYFLQYLDVAPTFRDADGLINFTDTRGGSIYISGGSQWRRGTFRSYNIDFSPQYTWHADGRPFQRGGGFDVNMDTRSDWRFGINASSNRFDDQTDETYGVSVTSGVSNRFRQWGFLAITGRQANEPYSFVGPTGSVRLFRHLDVSYGGALQSFEGYQQQHIVTASYELSPTRSIGGRVVVQGADTNWYLSYRSSGARGTEVFVILGDPNAARFRQIAAVKLIFAL